MSIHAHPDDQEFTVGGTLAKWARAGSEIVTVCLTSGEAGSNDSTPADMTRAKLIPIRQEEQRLACQVLGIKEVVFLDAEDGMLQPTLALRREVTRVIRRFRPDAVVCGDPTVRFYGNRYLNHPDHRVAADVALDAVFPSAESAIAKPCCEAPTEPFPISFGPEAKLPARTVAALASAAQATIRAIISIERTAMSHLESRSSSVG